MISVVLIILTFFATYKGQKDNSFQHRYLFNIDAILKLRQYDRLLSSGFLHNDWMHFAFNMLALVFFGFFLESRLGPVNFLTVYFVSLMGGSLMSLLVNKRNGSYSALGASGAVAGVLFSIAYIAPFMPIYFGIPAGIFAIVYSLISIVGMIKKSGNVGHDAHYGGAISGLLITIILRPDLLEGRIWLVALLLGIAIGVMVFVTKFSYILLLDKPFKKKDGNPHKYETVSREKELDTLLDKVRKRGMKGLSKKEKERLDELSELIGE